MRLENTSGEEDLDAAFNRIVTGYYERILKFCAYALGGNLRTRVEIT
jgi:hypothetical protein